MSNCEVSECGWKVINWLVERISSSEVGKWRRKFIDWLVKQISSCEVSEWAWKIINWVVETISSCEVSEFGWKFVNWLIETLSSGEGVSVGGNSSSDLLKENETTREVTGSEWICPMVHHNFAMSSGWEWLGGLVWGEENQEGRSKPSELLEEELRRENVWLLFEVTECHFPSSWYSLNELSIWEEEGKGKRERMITWKWFFPQW
jgi:hypothetical protein